MDHGALSFVGNYAALQADTDHQVCSSAEAPQMAEEKEKNFVAFAFIVCGHMCSLPELKQGSTDLEVQCNKSNFWSESCF